MDPCGSSDIRDILFVSTIDVSESGDNYDGQLHYILDFETLGMIQVIVHQN